MRVAVSGSSGMVGGALVRFLQVEGHEVLRLVRRPAKGPHEALWDPTTARVDEARLEGLDAVVHLAGEPLDRRWTDEQKRAIRESRTGGTRLLADALARLARKPEVLVCASAVGYYGDRGDEVLSEASAPGDDFLAETCRLWEAATLPAAEAGVRVVNSRFGLILSRQGGALRKMLLPFRAGIGGRLGDGRQWWSWVALHDVVRAIRRFLEDRAIRGPVNVVAPEPARNADFTKALGRALHRPTVLPMPAFAARLVFGEMADALLLSGQHVSPRRLEEAGYRFVHPDLEPALRTLMKSPAS